jgi:hypothetical protein
MEWSFLDFKKNCAQNFNSENKLKKSIGKRFTSWLVVVVEGETSSCKWTNLPSCDFALKPSMIWGKLQECKN